MKEPLFKKYLAMGRLHGFHLRFEESHDKFSCISLQILILPGFFVTNDDAKIFSNSIRTGKCKLSSSCPYMVAVIHFQPVKIKFEDSRRS